MMFHIARLLIVAIPSCAMDSKPHEGVLKASETVAMEPAVGAKGSDSSGGRLMRSQNEDTESPAEKPKLPQHWAYLGDLIAPGATQTSTPCPTMVAVPTVPTTILAANSSAPPKPTKGANESSPSSRPVVGVGVSVTSDGLTAAPYAGTLTGSQVNATSWPGAAQTLKTLQGMLDPGADFKPIPIAPAASSEPPHSDAQHDSQVSKAEEAGAVASAATPTLHAIAATLGASQSSPSSRPMLGVSVSGTSDGLTAAPAAGMLTGSQVNATNWPGAIETLKTLKGILETASSKPPHIDMPPPRLDPLSPPPLDPPRIAPTAPIGTMPQSTGVGLPFSPSSPSSSSNESERKPTLTETADQRALPKQDCTWYDWSPWSFCSRSCGNGFESRQRIVAIEASNGGAACEGSGEEFGSCNTQECAVDCEFADWGNWSSCTASCDGGVRQRRKPIKVANNSVGRACDKNEGFQSEECNQAACAKPCKWSDWSEWSSCTKSCGVGITTKTRAVLDPGTENGPKCEGPTELHDDCNHQACPKDCEMQDWEAWGECSASCGNGTQLRKRGISKAQEGGGQPCGLLQEETVCRDVGCPLDCSWQEWSEWSVCSVTCGSPGAEYATSARNAKRESNGGRPCTGEDSRKKLCAEAQCPEDCAWNDWSPWKACTKTCGGGISERNRNSSKSAKNGGVQCEGSTVDVKPCEMSDCPVDCRVSEWGTWSDCTESCGTGSAVRFRVEQVSATLGGKQCRDKKMETRECIGSDCVPTQTLILTGQAVQVTGAMQLITEDPVSFAANPQVEQVLKAGIVKFSKVPVRRVHVSSLPGESIGKHARTVDIWFSMLVPTDANVTEVINQLTKGGQDLVQASRVLKLLLSEAGVLINLKLTKFIVTKIKYPKKKVIAAHKILPNVTKVTSDWDAANASRLTGVMKVLLPTSPRQFAEERSCSKATERLLAALVGVEELSVHASLVPNQAIAGYSGDPEASEDNATLGASSGEVDVWFSLVAPPMKTREEAVRRGKEMCAAMRRQDLKEVSVRLGLQLGQQPPTPLCSAQSGTVIFLMCKAEGAYDETLEDNTPAKRVTGVMELEVQKPREFAADHRSEDAAKLTISQLAGVDINRIQVAIAPALASHVLEIIPGRSPNSKPKIVEVDEQGEEAENETFVEQDSADHTGKCHAWYVILVPAKPHNAEAKLVKTLRDLGDDTPLIELKYQNNLMNAGMDSIARVTDFYVDGWKGFKDPGADNKSSSDESSDKSSSDESTTTVTPCSSGNALGDAVIADEQVPASNVVAVVSNTASSVQAPPTLSNPGGSDEDTEEQLSAASSAQTETAQSLLETQDAVKSAAIRPDFLLVLAAAGLMLA